MKEHGTTRTGEALLDWWSRTLPSMSPREHLVDSCAYIIEEVGPDGASDEALLEYFVHDNLGLRGWSVEEFVALCPWARDALIEARAEGAARREEGWRILADPEVRRQIQDAVESHFGSGAVIHW